MKVCSKCKVAKDVSNFSPNGSVTLASLEVVVYLKSHCKDCNKRGVSNVLRSSKRAYLLSKWQHIKDRCESDREGSYIDKTYVDRDEFVSWAINRYDFNSIYDNWASNGYNMQDASSIDRIDVNGHYELSNMQFIPFSINSIKDKKKVVHVISPEGVEYNEVGVRDFCAKHDMSESSMYRLRSGKVSICKGWVLA